MKAQALMKFPMALMAATLVLSTSFAPAYAFRLSVGTVQAEKRLEPKNPSAEDVNEPIYDLTESVAVVSMVKLLAHYLPQQVYFLNSDPSPNYPSISIISLLIKLAAASRGPDRPIMVKREKSELNLPPPVINTDWAVNLTKPKPEKKGSKISIGQKTPTLDELDPETTIKKEMDRRSRSLSPHSLDDAQNQEATDNNEDTAEHNKLKTANLYTDFLAPVSRLSTPKENMQFLFWTCPPTSEQVPAREISTDVKFEGSFVVSQHGTRFKSVHGRQFTLDEGKLLACNRQAELSFQTPQASIVLSPGATALITLNKNNLTVQAIESGKNASVTIAPHDGKKVNLETGQQLVIDSAGKASTSQFSISQLTQKERLIDAQSSYLNQNQAAALAELLKRVSAATTAAGSSNQ